jgi:hypothetical protein
MPTAFVDGNFGRCCTGLFTAVAYFYELRKLKKHWAVMKLLNFVINQIFKPMKTINSTLSIVPVMLISNAIYMSYTSQFPGGVAGMAPFVLMFNSAISLVISILIYALLNIKFCLSQVTNILIYVVISFLGFMYFGASIFNGLELWLYLSVLISAFLCVMAKMIFLIVKVLLR